MKNKKKFILSLSALAFCFIASGGALTAVKANAETVNNTVDTVDFQMAAGAAIRIDTNADDNKDENGIRYQITMPETEYKALEANTAYESVSYGVLIAPKDYAAANPLNKANVFGIDDEGNPVEAVYDWAVKNETTGEWDYTSDGSKTRIMNFETDTLSVWSKNTAMRTYFGAIVNLNEKNLIRDFVGVGYIKYTVGTKTNYVFAAENDNVRSMSQVARLAYVDTSDQALEQDTKDNVKETYIDNVYGTTFDFNEDNDKYLAKNCGDGIVPDSEVSGVTGLQGTFKNGKTTGVVDGVSYDFKIDLGGEYQFKDISQIIIKYRVDGSNNDNTSDKGWWRLFLNDNTTENSTDDTQALSKANGDFSVSPDLGRDSDRMSEYATATIDAAKAVSAAGLTEDDYLYAISFGYRQQTETIDNRFATIIIDSIELKVFDEDFLEFNSEEALSLIAEGYNTSLVDLGDENKALQADLQASVKQSDGSWSTRYNLKINLGGKYQVEQIESVTIRYKVVSVTGDSVSSGWQVHFNAAAYAGSLYKDRITGLTHNTFTTMNNFVSNFIYSEDGKTPNLITNAKTDTTSGTTGLTSDSYLENIFFCVNGNAGGTVTIQIDYIKITLKA